ncbi:unnamed protein product [Lepidochelys kempii]
MREPLSLLFTTWGFSSQTLTAAQKPRGSSAALSRSAIAPASSPMCPAPAPGPAGVAERACHGRRGGGGRGGGLFRQFLRRGRLGRRPVYGITQGQMTSMEEEVRAPASSPKFCLPANITSV